MQIQGANIDALCILYIMSYKVKSSESFHAVGSQKLVKSMRLTREIIVLLVTMVAVLRETRAKPPSRLVGGEDAAVGEFPYLVVLMMKGAHKCGGSIIGKRHVLTAAHCIYGVSKNQSKDLSVVTGTNQVAIGAGKAYRIKSVAFHPEYSNTLEGAWKNDIAVITLRRDLVFNDLTRPIALPEEDTPENRSCVASGWGDLWYPDGIAPIDARKISQTTLTNLQCQSFYKMLRIFESHLCAIERFGVGLCSGDSGGPLVYNRTLVGIASFVIPCAKGKPDVFTRVYSYLDFIRQAMMTDS